MVTSVNPFPGDVADDEEEPPTIVWSPPPDLAEFGSSAA